jgi:hypothetical protein
MSLSPKQIQRIAGLELNLLSACGVLDARFEKAAVAEKGTPVYDINGTILFYRMPLTKGKRGVGFADIASEEALGEPLIAATAGAGWNEDALLKKAASEAKKCKKDLKFDECRFVAYSFPKVAIQFLHKDKEVLMLELHTWTEIPAASGYKDRKPMEPSNFERWSFLDELPKDILRERTKIFKERLELWDLKEFVRLDPRIISKQFFKPLKFQFTMRETRELHYSKRSTDHHVCYELRGQQTNVWCVGASVEMLMNFYRYEYNQVRLATELGLGTLAAPNGLPYARVADVVTVIERLSSRTLDATMHVNPAWSIFKNEITANRPLISFVPGHSRTVAGYTETRLIMFPGGSTVTFRGLLVYDPWPPNAGVITRWENFATQTYQYAYSAVLQHV